MSYEKAVCLAAASTRREPFSRRHGGANFPAWTPGLNLVHEPKPILR